MVISFYQESQNHSNSHLKQLLAGQEGFVLLVIRQTILKGGPNNPFERFKFRDESCGYYWFYYYCVRCPYQGHIPGILFMAKVHSAPPLMCSKVA